jgi:hypothetical protein
MSQYQRTIPLMAGIFPRGVISPRSVEGLAGGLDSCILMSGVSAPPLFPLAGEDWKSIGDDDGTAASPLARLDARGVV